MRGNHVVWMYVQRNPCIHSCGLLLLTVFTTAYFSHKVRKCKTKAYLDVVRYSSAKSLQQRAQLCVRHSSGRYSLHPSVPGHHLRPTSCSGHAAVRSWETENISETSSSLSHDPNAHRKWEYVLLTKPWCTWVQRGERMLGVATGVGLPMIHRQQNPHQALTLTHIPRQQSLCTSIQIIFWLLGEVGKYLYANWGNLHRSWMNKYYTCAFAVFVYSWTSLS